ERRPAVVGRRRELGFAEEVGEDGDRQVERVGRLDGRGVDVGLDPRQVEDHGPKRARARSVATRPKSFNVATCTTRSAGRRIESPNAASIFPRQLSWSGRSAMNRREALMPAARLAAASFSCLRLWRKSASLMTTRMTPVRSAAERASVGKGKRVPPPE